MSCAPCLVIYSNLLCCEAHLFSKTKYRNAPKPLAETSSATKSRGIIMVVIVDDEERQKVRLVDTSDWNEHRFCVVCRCRSAERFCVVCHCRSLASLTSTLIWNANLIQKLWATIPLIVVHTRQNNINGDRAHYHDMVNMHIRVFRESYSRY